MALLPAFACQQCKPDDKQEAPVPEWKSAVIDGVDAKTNPFNVSVTPLIKIAFSTALHKENTGSCVALKNPSYSMSIPIDISFEDNDHTLVIKPKSALLYLTHYSLSVSDEVKSTGGKNIPHPIALKFTTALNKKDKFPRVTNDELLELVQKQTFKYFWDYAHPVSGLARDKTNDNEEDCAMGGSGFGVMTIPIAVSRHFITRAQGLERMKKITSFLKNTATRFHGAFPHRVNGTTGEVWVWSNKDDGADIVETSFLMMGLLTVRQYFDGTGADERSLRQDITSLYLEVDWTWFTQNKKGLYWLWSPNYGWDITFLLRGWNETLITYILAAASSTHTIDKEVYSEGFANHGGIKNGKMYYDLTLPLGPDYGGPLFLSQYTFLGINPKGLKDDFADYELQTKNHALINYNYCKANPKKYYLYADSCWGLSASATRNGYKANSPTHDTGTICPSAAISSYPFTPEHSKKALEFFYYQLGDKLWGNYGFADSFEFSQSPPWIANQYLVYEQGPVIIMIENYRTGLPWRLFMSCPEVQTGLTKLGFTY